MRMSRKIPDAFDDPIGLQEQGPDRANHASRHCAQADGGRCGALHPIKGRRPRLSGNGSGVRAGGVCGSMALLHFFFKMSCIAEKAIWRNRNRQSRRPSVASDAGDGHDARWHSSWPLRRMVWLRSMVAAPRPMTCGRHIQRIVQLGRAQLFGLDAAHGQHQLRRPASSRYDGARLAQHLGTRALGELQIVGVIDDAAGVGVRIDPDRDSDAWRLWGCLMR